jgi:uncharacterized protein YgbK (DUF1537 family)
MSVKYAWYGDDFTGASDTLATVAQGGLRAFLFLGVPTAAHRAAVGELDALGIAGAVRAMAPVAMERELAPVTAFFATLGARVLHYKCCSTFDSAPQVGNLGVALRVLAAAASNRFVPIVGGQPSLGRYCAFGNLFAAAGDGGVHRIDRHPTMSVHPVTPMNEADLRRHLAAQGIDPIALVDARALADRASLDARFAQARAAAAAVLFDTLDDAHLAAIGRLLWQEAAHACSAPAARCSPIPAGRAPTGRPRRQSRGSAANCCGASSNCRPRCVGLASRAVTPRASRSARSASGACSGPAPSVPG